MGDISNRDKSGHYEEKRKAVRKEEKIFEVSVYHHMIYR